jgi:NADPH-dependent 2,4-dienoyl-CoA reductase/sulfur reductase-like enzyme
MVAAAVIPKEKILRDDVSKLKVSEQNQMNVSFHQTSFNMSQIIIVGAGLGGLGAAIALLLAGHDVEVFESASEIGEVRNSLQFHR